MRKNNEVWYESLVYQGKKLGRKLGFPTVNLDPSVLPQSEQKGVFASLVEYKNSLYKGALYFGPRLVLDETKDVLEIFIFDFSAQIYEKKIRFCLKKFIRPPLTFSDFSELQKQLVLDKISVDNALREWDNKFYSEIPALLEYIQNSGLYMYINLVRFTADFLVYFLLLTPFLCFVLKKYDLGLKILISLFLTVIIRGVVAALWYEPRPYVTDPSVLLFPIRARADSSFFSLHSAISFAVAGAVFWSVRSKISLTLLIIGGMIAASRVLAGYHYFWDVIAGSACGFIISFLVERNFLKLKKKINYLLDN